MLCPSASGEEDSRVHQVHEGANYIGDSNGRDESSQRRQEARGGKQPIGLHA